MKKVLSFSAMLMLGLLLSQVLPDVLGADYEVTREGVEVLLGICLAFIMINVGREFEIEYQVLCQGLPCSHAGCCHAVVAHSDVLYLCDDALGLVWQWSSMERVAATEPFRCPHLGRYPLHDAGCYRPAEKLDIQENSENVS